MPALASHSPLVRTHAFDHHPSFRAVLAAAPVVAELAKAAADEELLAHLIVACGELVAGFGHAANSPDRARAHRRAWATIRQLERGVIAARLGKLAPARLVARARRAVDKADVLVSTLPGVLPD
ncbi:MAG: hypothetical protein JO257_37210 [Deltaproteobacteria bacterium]|nr:hypothetical protein [Deltaproteobacteria bacterium]